MMVETCFKWDCPKSHFGPPQLHHLCIPPSTSPGTGPAYLPLMSFETFLDSIVTAVISPWDETPRETVECVCGPRPTEDA